MSAFFFILSPIRSMLSHWAGAIAVCRPRALPARFGRRARVIDLLEPARPSTSYSVAGPIALISIPLSIAIAVGAVALLLLFWYGRRRGQSVPGTGSEKLATASVGAAAVRGSEGAAPEHTERPDAEVSPLRVEGLLEGLADPFFVVDAHSAVTYANPATGEFFGLGEGEVVGRTLWEVLPEGLETQFRVALPRVLQEQAYTTFEGFFDPPGRWLEVRGFPQEDGVAVYIQDISRRKWAEEDLQRTKESLTHAQELAHVGSWDFEGSSGRYTWSDETYRILGYEPGEFPATLDALLRVVHPEDRSGLMSAIALGSRGIPAGGGEATHYEHRVVRDDGEIHYVKGVARVIPASQERPSYVVGAVQDITEQKRGEEALRAATEEAQRANRAKSELLSRTSHELRTPLNAILGFGQLLEIEVEGEENRESVAQILRAGRNLLKLVDQVLDIAQGEVGRLAVDIVPIATEELVDEALAVMTPLARSKEVELSADFSTLARVAVLGDRARLLQVLLNLISNAIKYNRAGGRVEISSQRVDDRIHLTIQDTGLGIEPETMERLFFPFERGTANEQGVDGTGLGLALSRSLIEAMDGRIGATTTQGDGSTFWIDLPAGEQQPEPLPEASPPGSSDQEISRSGRTIVYIEDNSTNIRLVERILTRRRPDVTIIAATQGRLGIELVNEHRPDLVLLDLNLPELSGTEVLTALQTDESTRHIPVIMITGDANPGQEQRLRELGAAAYLSKPFDVHQFLGVLDQVLFSDAAPGGPTSEG